ncbi:transcription factor domain-containing protein [Aspergillus lucknowensis]|uniref:Fungal-specific transcription factor domain-containing protein n=1 Tax=Aspergillus lucknowensis TaxID=176173 RepID=A0ABR4LYH3_9EURO
MPRAKVSEESRRRIAKACLHCQSSKQKCDGKSPCSACVRRHCPASCAYSDHVRSYGHRRRRTQKAVLASERNASDSLNEIAVPKLPQSLYDTRGKVVYLGDCSALSFLQNLQELIERETRPNSALASTREFEELPPDPDEGSLSYTGNVDDLTGLVKTFFTVTSGVLDIIEQTHAETLLTQWIHGSRDSHRGHEAVLYLILAYAAQAQASSPLEQRRAHSFYHHGRHIALLHLTDDASVETVQAFLLICLYMLGCSRRNGAFLNLGIAISAAKALGLHRRETNRSFPEDEARLRERIWTSLRYHDLFFCAMMGRTSSTITTDCTVPYTQPSPEAHIHLNSAQERAMALSAHAFSFMERTVNEIYTKRTVSMGALKDLATELRDAISRIPGVFTCDTNSTISQEILLRNANVLCSYHFTMMLLTRPFVVANLRAHPHPNSSLSHKSSSSSSSIHPVQQNDTVYEEIVTNALSCIDAAIETIRILSHLLTTNALLRNMPLTVAWTFVSALTVCSAYFGQLGCSESNATAIDQARRILDHFAVSSPQARRYSGILAKLSTAATVHHNSRQTDGREVYVSGTPSASQDDPLQEGGSQLGTGDVDLFLQDPWNINSIDVNLFPLDLGNAESIWNLNWVGSLM